MMPFQHGGHMKNSRMAPPPPQAAFLAPRGDLNTPGGEAAGRSQSLPRSKFSRQMRQKHDKHVRELKRVSSQTGFFRGRARKFPRARAARARPLSSMRRNSLASQSRYRGQPQIQPEPWDSSVEVAELERAAAEGRRRLSLQFRGETRKRKQFFKSRYRLQPPQALPPPPTAPFQAPPAFSQPDPAASFNLESQNAEKIEDLKKFG